MSAAPTAVQAAATEDEGHDGTATDSLSDVFDSSYSPPHHQHFSNDNSSSTLQDRHKHDILSDIPRLRDTHTKEGYRAGVTAAKANTLQRGFDEGYSLGAVMGWHVGDLLGVLEVLHRAASGKSTTKNPQDYNDEAHRTHALLVQAQEDLKLENLFGRKFWSEEGTWTYPVPPHTHNSHGAAGSDNARQVKGSGGNAEDDVTFHAVAQAHPLVIHWTSLVQGELRKSGVDRHAYRGERWEAGRMHDDDNTTIP